MADRWVTVRDGQLLLVEELDGWAYLRAKDQGKQTAWESPTTLSQLVALFGADSPLVAKARALLEAPHGQA